MLIYIVNLADFLFYFFQTTSEDPLSVPTV